MTDLDGIISDGTDGSGEASAGSSNSLGRATPDPAEAETDSGSTSDYPSASSEAEGFTSSADPNESESDASTLSSVEEDLDEVSKVLQERDEFKDLALRAKADFENYRKRADRKVAESRSIAVAGVVRELMPVIDNLDRAVEAAGAAPTGDAFADGVRLVHSDLHSVLDRLGLTSIDPAGETFNPSVHEAIAQAPVEGVAAGTIVEVAQKGFMLGEIVVRPARVVVAA